MKWSRFLPLFLLILLLVLSGCTLARDNETPPINDITEPGSGGGTNPDVPTSDGGGASGELDWTTQALTNPTDPNSAAFMPGEVVVKFTSDALPQLPSQKREDPGGISIESATLDPIFNELNITGLEPVLASVAEALNQPIESLRALSDNTEQLYVASFDETTDPMMVSERLSNNPQVEYAEPNYFAFASGEPQAVPLGFTPNDPYFPVQWNMSTIQMPQAWDITRGAGVVVAVLDTGVAYETFEGYTQAPDLAGTAFVPGYDFINNDAHPNDDHGHGTHVAGTVAQTTDNGVGVVGVAYQAFVMPVKVLDARGQGDYAAIIQGINFAVRNGAKVINMSLSGHTGSIALEEALNQAKAAGVTIVTAAGNSNGAVEFPARYGSTIAVGAVNYNNERARYSNYGAELDLVAPGGDNNRDDNGDGFGDGIVQQSFKPGEMNNFRYLFFEGTSMASPHVSGVIALILSLKPDITPDQINGVLQQSAVDLGPPGRDDEYGAGLLQAANALAAIGASPPTTEPPTTEPPTPTSVFTAEPVPTDPPPGEPTPTATPPTQPPTTPVGDLIINGSFEVDEAWEFRKTEQQGSYSANLAHSGARSALVGILDPNADRYSFSSVAQRVTIPADIQRATLTAFIFPISQDVQWNDIQVVSILDENFNLIKHLATTVSNNQVWEQQVFDVTEFAGRTVYVYFGAVNVRNRNLGQPTALYVDDVSLVIEQVMGK